jgi:hypothetical protein
MRAFVELKRSSSSREDLALAQLEQKCDQQFKLVFETIRNAIIPQEMNKRKIGIGSE